MPRQSREVAEQRRIDNKIAVYVRTLQAQGLTQSQIADRVFQKLGYLVKRVNEQYVALNGVKGRDWIVKLKEENMPVDKERIKELMKDYGQLERQAKAAFKKANDAHAKLWQSADGSAEAKKWNAEWKKQEAAGVEFRRKANVILDRVERLKEENPMPAKKQITKRKVSKKGPSPAQLRARKAFAAAAKARSKAAKKNAAEKPKRQNKTIITKPKKVVVINKLKNGKAILPTRYKWSHVSGNQIRWVMEYDMYGDGDLHVYERTYPSLSGLLTDLRNKFGAGFANKIQKEIQPKKNPGKSTRHKYRNGYLDLVIMGHATPTKQGNRTGWTVRGGGAKSKRKGAGFFPAGKGIVPVSRSGYYLDRATGMVFARKGRNPNYTVEAIPKYTETYKEDVKALTRGSAVRQLKRKVAGPKEGYRYRVEKNVAQGFFDGNGIFHPIRSSADYDSGTAGETGRKPIRTQSKKRKASLKKASQTARLKAETKRRKSTASRLASRSLSKSAGILKGSGSRRQRKNPALKIYTVTAIPLETGKREKLGDYEAFTSAQAIRKAKADAAELGARFKAKAYQVKLNTVATRQFYARFSRKPALESDGRRNPSVKSIRKEFAGTLGKATDAFAPIGTPRNVAKLGKLLLIDTENATIKPTGIVYLCADSKGKLHLCGSKNVPIYSGAAQSFGRVKKLEYETAKPHLYPGQGTIQFWHKMGEESGNQPTLYADGKGGLRFRGGSYKITREGIVD